MTGTHGSGLGNTILAKTVVGLQMVHANGELKTYTSESIPNFDRYLICVGALGIVVTVTMLLEPHYNVAKGIYFDLPLDECLRHMDEIIGPGQSLNQFVSVFMDWKEPRMNSVWMGQKYTAVKPPIPTNCYSASHIPGTQLHPVPGQDPIACVHTGYGSWTGKLNHFLPDYPPSSAGNEIQAEYFIPYRHLKAAVQALWDIRHRFSHLVQITELRAVAQDNLPMSQAKNEAAGAIHFTLVK
jgi:xylitol oxidase